MRVLTVDDDRVMQEILRHSLQRMGHAVTVTSNGLEAWQAHDRTPFSLIISDWLMPRLSGLDLCKQVRARGGQGYTYFILLTSRDGTEDYRTAMDAGVDDFVSKPLEEQELFIRVRVAERILKAGREIERLEHLLPICIYCKKIRGPGDAWGSLEEYVTDQAGSQVTHVVCPHCQAQGRFQA